MDRRQWRPTLTPIASPITSQERTNPFPPLTPRPSIHEIMPPQPLPTSILVAHESSDIPFPLGPTQVFLASRKLTFQQPISGVRDIKLRQIS